jgi:hypothetical protein
MKTKRNLSVLVCTMFLLSASAQKDTSHYMFSFISINAGYGVNTVSPSSKTQVAPFWGTSGPTVSVMGLIALKGSYIGIPIMLGYSAPKFDAADYGKQNPDTSQRYKYYTYNSSTSGNYNMYYLMTGLELKLPERTTREAFELRFMIGPLIATEPAFTYSYGNPNYLVEHVTSITSATSVAFAFSPGISFGYKLTQHLAIMADADVLFAQLKFSATESWNDFNSVYVSPQITILSAMGYLHLTGGIAYTFGKMTPNISY